MPLQLGTVVPNFEAETTEGKIRFHEWIGDSWAILFSHPSDFTPVCTTELGKVALMSYRGEFRRRNVKPIAVSCDSVPSHLAWIKDIHVLKNLNPSFDPATPSAPVNPVNPIEQQQQQQELPFPIIADPDRTIAVAFGMLDPDERDSKGIPLTARAVFVIGPDKKLKLSLLYPATTGRDFDEILRTIDSLQLTAGYSVATPANWRDGDRCMILPSIPKEEAEKKFPQGYEQVNVPSGKPYLRLTPQPNKGKKEPTESAPVPVASAPEPSISSPSASPSSSLSTSTIGAVASSPKRSSPGDSPGFLDLLSYSGFFHVGNAIFEGFVGLCHLLSPDLIYQGTQGTDPTIPALLLSRFFGASVVSLAIVGYLARNDTKSPAGRAILVALAFYHTSASTLGFALGTNLSGKSPRSQDIIHALIHGILALGFWFQFLKRRKGIKEKDD